ncbi:MAG: FkbM family methyltransferase [Gammaproteobacteria bacterium]
MDEQNLTSILKPPFQLKQCRNGWFVCNTNDYYIGLALYLYGEFSENEATIFRQLIRPGQTVLDVGANIGAHTVLFAQLTGPAGQVYAFEPQRLVFQQLCTNVTLNSLPNVYCQQIGLSDHIGSMIVPPVNYNKLGNFGLVSLVEDGIGESVAINTIDNLHLSACHFLKIDVEAWKKKY